MRRILESNSYAASSCLAAAEAVAAVQVAKRELKNTEKEVFKEANRAARDLFLWRCVGHKLGLDSRSALVRSFEAATHETDCAPHTVLQP